MAVTTSQCSVAFTHIQSNVYTHLGALFFPPLMETRNAQGIYNSRSRFFQITIISAFGKIIMKLMIFKPFIRIYPAFKLCHPHGTPLLYKSPFQMFFLSSFVFPSPLMVSNSSQMILLLGKPVQRCERKVIQMLLPQRSTLFSCFSGQLFRTAPSHSPNLCSVFVFPMAYCGYTVGQQQDTACTNSCPRILFPCPFSLPMLDQYLVVSQGVGKVLLE